MCIFLNLCTVFLWTSVKWFFSSLNKQAEMKKKYGILPVFNHTELFEQL